MKKYLVRLCFIVLISYSSLGITQIDKSDWVWIDDQCTDDAGCEKLLLPPWQVTDYEWKKSLVGFRGASYTPDYSGLPAWKKLLQMEQDHQAHGLPLPYSNEKEKQRYVKDVNFSKIFEDLQRYQAANATPNNRLSAQDDEFIEVFVIYQSKDPNSVDLHAEDLQKRTDILLNLPENSYIEIEEGHRWMPGRIIISANQDALLVLYADKDVLRITSKQDADSIKIQAY